VHSKTTDMLGRYGNQTEQEQAIPAPPHSLKEVLACMMTPSCLSNRGITLLQNCLETVLGKHK